MSTLEVFNAIIWYESELAPHNMDCGITTDVLRGLDYDDIRSLLEDCKRAYDDINPTVEQAWGRA